MLRGLAALSVAAFHAFQWIDDRDWVGAAGVDVFFVISGFIIWTVAQHGGEAAPHVFLWRRFTRVAPAYWLATTVVIAIALVWPLFLPQVSLSPRHVILSYLFVQHTDPNGLAFPVLPLGWSLNYEAVFYLMVTTVLFAPRRVRFPLVLAAPFALLAYGFHDPPVYGLGANPMMLQFAAGACLAEAHAAGKRIEPGAGAMLAALGVAAFVIMGLTGFRNLLWRPFLWGAPAVMIVAGALGLENARRIRPPRALVALGDASYAVYLVHMVAVAAVAHTLGVQPIAFFVFIAVAAAVAAGLAFHRWVERPLIATFRALPGRLAAMRRDNRTQA